MRTIRSLSALPAAFLLITGCGGVAFRVGGGAPEPPAAAAEGPQAKSPPKAAELPSSPNKEEAAIRSALQFVETQKNSYKISPAELLDITVYQENDLDRTARVSPDGTITIPLAGSVKVGGMSIPEAEQAIRDKLKRYLINPQVSVFVKEYGNKQVYVLGQVKSPGSYPLPQNASLTVIEAITLAGGFTEYASIDRTRVIRKSEDGSRAFMIEISAIMKHGDKSKDIPLVTNDVIFVPESFF